MCAPFNFYTTYVSYFEIHSDECAFSFLHNVRVLSGDA